jgi:NDP-sugar pyrophosphorylase family protein
VPIEFDPAFWSTTWTRERNVHGNLKSTILAAGLGKRMDPLTAHHLPKPLFPLGGKVPMSEVWIRRLVKSGITDISMNLCVLSETIRRYFKNGAKFGAEIQYVNEQVPSGTLGGVCKQSLGKDSARVFPGDEAPSIARFKGSTVIAPSGDIVTNFGSELLEKMYDIHKKVGAAFTMVLVPVPLDRRKNYGTAILGNPDAMKGIVSNSGRIEKFMEKDPNSPSNLCNASIYMIEMDLIETLDRIRTEVSLEIAKPFYDFGKHVFPAMLEQLPYVSLPKDHVLWGIQYDGRWYDVGQKRDYLRVNEQLLDGKIEIDLPYEKLPWGFLGTNVVIDFARTTIVPPVIIGNNCIIEPGVTIGPYAVIGDGWVVENGAHIRNSVLWERYSFFTEHGEISAEERKLVDRHLVRKGITIQESIIVGGSIDADVHEKTVDVSENGQLAILPIDYVPDGPRA